MVTASARDANGHRGLVFHPRCKNAIRDFTLYHRRRVSSGEYTEEPAPNVGRSNRDDACDCVRVYAAHRLESRSKVIKVVR